ncbi:MAG: 2-amino-4-hydroxy-6-hydroxymethyldihydropteridine diphosphokinase [Betaproteobacteria bacterium]|nr:2-amino-4-hydroxy-6-hydroxymethyldihydropteridine diphosphokinase [Betaproteobacteria bacterium]
MTRAYIALGSNLADPVTQLGVAFDELGRLPQTRFVARSSLWRSAPVGYLDQPDFVNAVAEVETALEAETLLAHLLDIERRHGRVREFQNAPRTLDLDIALYGDDRIDTPILTVPHPRMQERAFVLLPLNELAPDIVIPGHGALRDLLPGVAGQRLEVMPG